MFRSERSVCGMECNIPSRLPHLTEIFSPQDGDFFIFSPMDYIIQFQPIWLKMNPSVLIYNSEMEMIKGIVHQKNLIHHHLLTFTSFQTCMTSFAEQK